MSNYSIGRKYKLSIYFGFHDTCVTISDNKEILLHLEAERVYRKKHMRLESTQEMNNFIQVGLEHLQIKIDNIEEVYVAEWNNKYDFKNLEILGRKFNPIVTSHHNSHIGSSYPGSFSDTLIVCADGGSEDGTTKLYHRKDNKVEMIEDLDNTPMTGKFYGTLTQMIIHPKCSRAHNHYAGKTMGLASLGHFDEKLYKKIEENWEEFNKLHWDGVDHLLKIFNIKNDYVRVWENPDLIQLAFNGQKFWVDKFYEKLIGLSSIYKNIALVGGCALNVVLNTKLAISGHFDTTYVTPISSDAGQSLGALLFYNPHLKCNYPFLGRGFGELEKMPERIIDDLLAKKIIAWYQGRSEIGPRALGHRSFLGIPTTVEMKEKLSIRVKGREPYRPVAPIILKDKATKFYEENIDSPYMTYSFTAKPNTKKLAPAVVHNDGTSRTQTLKKEENTILYEIIEKVSRITNAPIIMNTSLNVMDEPIVDTPEDVMKTFKMSKADVLYINGKRYEQ